MSKMNTGSYDWSVSCAALAIRLSSSTYTNISSNELANTEGLNKRTYPVEEDKNDTSN